MCGAYGQLSFPIISVRDAAIALVNRIPISTFQSPSPKNDIVSPIANTGSIISFPFALSNRPRNTLVART